MRKHTDSPCFRFKLAALVWTVLLLGSVWPRGVFGQSGEKPVGSGDFPSTKVSVYDRDGLSILIDAPAGVKLEVQGSANLFDWKRLAELTAGDKPLIWNPPNTLKEGNHFFRVTPMGGPNEAQAGGDEEDGGGNTEDSDTEKPNLDDPDITDGEEPIGPLLEFKKINHDSDLAKGLTKELLSGIDGQKLELIEIESAEELFIEEEGAIYFIVVLAKDSARNEFVVSGEFIVDDSGERKLDYTEVGALIDPASDLAKRLAGIVMEGLQKTGFEFIELKEIVAVEKYSDEEGEFYFVELDVLDDSEKIIQVVGEVEADEQGEPKLVYADLFEGEDPFAPNDPNDDIDAIEHVEPDSELGKALIKVAVAQLEDAELKLVEVVAMDRVRFDEYEFIELVLLAKDAEGHELTVFAAAAITDDGGFDVLDVHIGLVDPDGPGIIDPGFGGETEELDSESDLVQKLVTLALERSDDEGLELDQVTGALRLSFGPDETVYLIDFLVKGGEGEVQKAFAEIMETEDGQYEVGYVDIGDGGDWPHPEPEPGSHWIIVPPEGSRSHFIDPKSDLASELVTIVQLTIGDHVKTPWEIDHVEEAVRWHIPGEGTQFALLAKGVDANGKSGHLLTVLKRKDGSLTIELVEVRVGINPNELIKFPLSPEKND